MLKPLDDDSNFCSNVDILPYWQKLSWEGKVVGFKIR